MRLLLSLSVCTLVATALLSGDLEVARQALHDGVWRSALAAADLAATNGSQRTEARLVSLEALAYLEDDGEIRRRLAAWTNETIEVFRYWRAREQVRVGDFQQAKSTLEKPFSDKTLALPVACLNAVMLATSGSKEEALKLLGTEPLGDGLGLIGEDAKLLRGEILDGLGRKAESAELLRPLAKKGARLETRLKAGYLLGFAEMDAIATQTAGVARVRALLRAHPDHRLSVSAAIVFADKLLDIGDFAGADDEYRRYLEVNPAAATDGGVLKRRGHALFMLKRYSEAAGAFARAEQVLTEPMAKAHAAFRQADAFLVTGRYAEAAASYARSAAYGGEESLRARFAEADAYERDNKSEQAATIYEQLKKENSVWGARAQLRLTAMLSRKGRLAQAIESYTKLINATNLLTAADLKEAYLGRGRACYRDYRFNDAAADFEQVALRDPKMADGMHFLRALCHYGAGRDVDAKAEAASLMTSTKDQNLRADLMLWCAKYEFNHGEYSDARTHFETYASLRPKTLLAAEALLWAARCSFELTDYSKAVDLATQAANSVASDLPLFVEALLVQGEAIMEQGRYAEAVQVFDRAATQIGSGANATKAMMLKADALYAMGAGNLKCYEDAISVYRALIDGNSISPDRQVEVSFKIGRALEKLRRTREAMDQYYRNVVLAYSAGLAKGVLFGAPARTFFSRAAFAHVDYDVAAGDMKSAVSILGKVIQSDVPAAKEAQRRLAELLLKGGVE